MEFIDDLIISENLKHSRRVIRKLKKNKFVSGIYILRETYGNDQFEIIQSDFFIQKSLQNEKLRVLGLASDYADAIALSKSLLEEAYNTIGEPDIKKFLKL